MGSTSRSFLTRHFGVSLVSIKIQHILPSFVVVLFVTISYASCGQNQMGTRQVEARQTSASKANIGHRLKCAISKVVPEQYRRLWTDLMGNQIAKNLMQHYMDCDGHPYLLSVTEMAELQPQLIDDHAGHKMAKAIAEEFLKRISAEPKAETLEFPLKTSTLAWASGATLGNFTISFDGAVRFTRIDHEQTIELLSSQDPLGALTEAIGAMTTGGGDWVTGGRPAKRGVFAAADRDGFASWEYSGVVTYFDRWDFNVRPRSLKDLKSGTGPSQGRSDPDEIRVLIAHFLLPGRDFEIHSEAPAPFTFAKGILSVNGFKNDHTLMLGYSPYGSRVIAYVKETIATLRAESSSLSCKANTVASCWGDLNRIHAEYFK